jgi:hypothetical protein
VHRHGGEGPRAEEDEEEGSRGIVVATAGRLLLNCLAREEGTWTGACACAGRRLLSCSGRRSRSARRTPPPAGPPQSPRWRTLGVRWTFFGELVVNTNYNTHTMVVGSIPASCRSAPRRHRAVQRLAGNTFLGVSATPPRFGDVQLQAKFDMDFRSNAPYLNENAFLPWSATSTSRRLVRLRILGGQASDVLSPRAAASLNFYPLSFIPGDIGDYRPQIRVEWRQPVSDVFEIDFQTAIAQAVQTFQVSGHHPGNPDRAARLPGAHRVRLRTERRTVARACSSAASPDTSAGSRWCSRTPAPPQARSPVRQLVLRRRRLPSPRREHAHRGRVLHRPAGRRLLGGRSSRRWTR